MDKNKSPLYGDEGMWLLNALPHERIKERYNVDLPDTFGEHVMKAAVRMNSGGSAAFVSKEGLIATNHHVGRSHVHDLSTKDSDYIKDGFLARTRDEELKVPQLEVNVLDSIEDVSDRVLEHAGKDRDKEIAAIEEESKKETGLRSDVVTLYQGGKYHLYRYKKYTDVRLVFSPEERIASFGGDFDNYEFPRYCMDIAFFRVYDNNGKPLTPESHLTFSSKPLIEEELLFIAGHPGKTDRLTTLSAIKDIRDRALPFRLTSLRRLEIMLEQYSGRSLEAARRASETLFTVQNLRKRYLGQIASLQTPAFMELVEKREAAVKKNVELANNPWESIEKALASLKEIQQEYDLFESMIGFGGHYDKPKPLRSNWSTYLAIARTIVRMSEEDTKPSGDRLPEFADAKRDSLLEELYSSSPIYNDLERTILADALSLLVETYGPNDATVKEVLDGKSPQARARELVHGTHLEDPEVRKQLVNGGKEAVAESKDPMIALAKTIDGRARKVRERMDAEVQDVFEDAYNDIAQAQFAAYGEVVYPDATFTLRVAYGTAKSVVYEEDTLEHFTTISGTLAHGEKHGNAGLWELPPRWQEKIEWVKSAQAPFNFITTHDAHGGNSGSPVFTKDFEYVGILFDGIIEGEGTVFQYDDKTRSVCVSAAGVLEILKNIYGAENLVNELEG